jgi:hypothetical protein
MHMRRQPTLRTALVLLALGNLAMLGMRLWPWPDIMSLPGNGATGIDPAVTLAGYIALAYWIGTAREDESRKALFSAACLGLVSGFFLIIQVVEATRQAAADATAGPDRIQIGLVTCAVLIVGIAGLRTARAGHTAGFSAVCALWAAMTACLIATSAVLMETYRAEAPGESSDPWKDYQGLAIGTPATQSLVHSLNTVSGFLLIGPVVGCIAGALFASFARPEKG